MVSLHLRLRYIHVIRTKNLLFRILTVFMYTRIKLFIIVLLKCENNFGNYQQNDKKVTLFSFSTKPTILFLCYSGVIPGSIFQHFFFYKLYFCVPGEKSQRTAFSGPSEIGRLCGVCIVCFKWRAIGPPLWAMEAFARCVLGLASYCTITHSTPRLSTSVILGSERFGFKLRVSRNH